MTFMKNLFSGILLLFYGIIESQTRNISVETGTYNVYLGLESAEKVNPYMVEAILIECDKIDSITNNITKYKNLKFIEIRNCYYSSAFDLNKLSKQESDYYLTQNRKKDSLEKKYIEEKKSKGFTAERSFWDWDSLILSNRIEYISKDLYKLRKLEYISIYSEINKKSEKALLRYYRKSKLSLLATKNLHKCKNLCVKER